MEILAALGFIRRICLVFYGHTACAYDWLCGHTHKESFMSNKEETHLLPTELKEPSLPAFVETEKMFEKFAEVTREIATRAFNYFYERGAEFGDHLEDWLRAEAETLRTAPAKITEADGITTVRVAVPGFKPPQIEVSVKDNLLMVFGEAANDTNMEEEDVFYSEWQTNRFMRRLVLPYPVDIGSTSATLGNGVLTLVLKKKEETEAVKVAVKTA